VVGVKEVKNCPWTGNKSLQNLVNALVLCNILLVLFHFSVILMPILPPPSSLYLPFTLKRAHSFSLHKPLLGVAVFSAPNFDRYWVRD
jgi:hypothetical protein